MQQNTTASQNMYSTQQTQNYTYGADAQGTYDANAQNSAYNNAYYQNAYYNNAQANPYNTNYYTQATQQPTGTKITDNKPYSLLIWAALIFIGTLITSIQSDDSTAIVCGSIVAIVMVILFLVLIQKWLLVEYAGGRIRLSVKKYGMNNIIAFQKAIYRVKASSK